MLIGYARVSKGDDQSNRAQAGALAEAGRMMKQMFGSFAEFERAMSREWTTAGIAQTRAEGRICGRPRKLDPKRRREIAESVLLGRKSGAEYRQILETDNASQP